jgi:hypothetical protein
VSGRRAVGLALTAAAAVGSVVVGAVAAGAPRAATSAPAATICFDEPRIGPPPPEVHSRVAALTEGLAEPERAWIRALMTHESGGALGAVSPTGCAGPLAIQGCRGCTPCCVSDELDRSPRPYDRCSHEAAHGYLCSPATDPRFGAEFPLDYARGRIGGLRERLGADDFSFRTALALSWNAGSRAVAGYPDGLAGAAAAVERLDLRGVEPYCAWPEADRWNKLVEVYDYVLWFDALAEHWGAPAEPVRAPARAAAGGRCFERSASGFLEVPRPDGRPARLEIRRLRFGRYEPARVELY